MQKHQSTKELMHSLMCKINKKEFIDEISNDFQSVSDYFVSKGHQIDKQTGFLGKQILDVKDIFIYQYFRDLHFIYWGITARNWPTFDLIDEIYYENLKRIIEIDYNSKQ